MTNPSFSLAIIGDFIPDTCSFTKFEEKKLKTSIQTHLYVFFINNAFFKSDSVLLNFLMDWASNVAYMLLNT